MSFSRGTGCRLLLALGISLISLPSFAQTEAPFFKVETIASELIFQQAPFQQCHGSSLVELSGGRIMDVWFGGTHERNPDVCIWGAVRNAEGWTAPIKLADGIINDTLRYPCWNPVLFMPKNGDILLFYKIGPSPSTWRGLFKISHDGGQTWSQPSQLPEGIIGPSKNKPMYLPSGRIVSPSSVESAYSWKACMELSDDDGKTWSRVCIDTTSGYKLIQPALLTLRDGTLLALMRSDQNVIVESRSADGGNTWSKPVKTQILNPNSGIDAVTLAGGLQVLVYNPSVSGREWSEGRNKLFVMVSADGEQWQDACILEDQPSGEYSYPAVIQTRDGLVHITYTHGRKSIKHVVLKISEK